MKNTLAFLDFLDKNNNRTWFQEHKSDYEKSLAEMIVFADAVLAKMSTHDYIETSSGKKSLYRIYRDVRFSKDKTPYKTNWAGGLRRAGKENRGGYYFQVGLNGSFVMGGFFGPNKEDLLHVRKQLEQDAEPLREIIDSKQFKEFFGTLRGSQLKTAPKGFEKEHPDIDLLRYKQFIVRHDFTDSQVQSKEFPSIVANAFLQMRPFFDYMSDILTTDLNGRALL
jgi:uncharacterized protein (TIGR02453 family)